MNNKRSCTNTSRGRSGRLKSTTARYDWTRGATWIAEESNRRGSAPCGFCLRFFGRAFHAPNVVDQTGLSCLARQQWSLQPGGDLTMIILSSFVPVSRTGKLTRGLSLRNGGSSARASRWRGRAAPACDRARRQQPFTLRADQFRHPAPKGRSRLSLYACNARGRWSVPGLRRGSMSQASR